MAEANKDTIYVDVDDEITTIIDKMRASHGKVIALVLPKRATVLQSIVNMKLLQRTAGDAKKNLVLITSEAGLLPLAGAVGLYVAKTLTSRPEIPASPIALPAEESIDESLPLAVGDNPISAEADGDTPVGELAGSAAALPSLAAADSIETLELDDDLPEDSSPGPIAKPKLKAKKDKKLSVPNFDHFRIWLVLGVLLIIILVVGGYFAFDVLPKASISIQTDASNVNTSVDLTLDSAASSLNSTTNTVPAKQVQEQKTYTGSATTTGQKNEGDKASGSVTMTAQECAPNLSVTPSVPAGTGLSSNGLTYITQNDTSFSPTGGKGSCFNYKATAPTDIAAQNGGSNYNTDSNASFTVAGHSDITSATGSATGGTDNIIQVVSQADIDNATSKINAQSSTVQQDLESQLQSQNLIPISATFASAAPTTTDSANVGDQATTVTVTETVTSTMFGASKSDLDVLVDKDIQSQIDTSQQGILDDGLSGASYKLTAATATTAQLNLQTTAEVGPNINAAAIKQQAAGKKSGDIQSAIKTDPDVTSVNVHFSPFWVTSAPKKLTKITVVIAKPTKTVSANDNSN